MYYESHTQGTQKKTCKKKKEKKTKSATNQLSKCWRSLSIHKGFRGVVCYL